MPRRTDQGYQRYRDQSLITRTTVALLGFLGVLFVAHLAVSTLLVRTIEQQSASMEPTLSPGDRVFVVPLAYGPTLRLIGARLPGFRLPQRGDLVAIRAGYEPHAGFWRRLVDPVARFVTLGRSRPPGLQIKRIVGLPGDTLRMERFVIYVRPADAASFSTEFDLARRSYAIDDTPRPGAWQSTDPFGDAVADVTLGPDEYYVVSDNRSAGIDSRHWGPVGRDSIHGVLWIRYFPLRGFGRP